MNFDNRYGSGLFGNIPLVTKNLLIINFIMFFLTKLLITVRGIDLNDYLSLHHHLASSFKPHQWITYIFMHADLRHLLSNSIGLFIFGRLLEMTWGPKRFLIFYIVCGYGAAIPEYIIHNVEVMKMIDAKNEIFQSSQYSTSDKSMMMDIVYSQINNFVILGASGSLYGLLGAAAFLFGNMEMGFFFIPVRIKLKYLVSGYIILEIIGGLGAGDGVAHFAHMGGLIVGMATVLTLYRK